LDQALIRLRANAPRRPLVIYGRALTDAESAYNADVRDERVRMTSFFVGASDPRERTVASLALWRAWAGERAAEWLHGFWDKAEMTLFETRFAKFWATLLTLDLGTSFLHRRPVWDLSLERLRVSLTLSFGALMLAYALSVPLGIGSAVTHGTPVDRVASTALFVLYSLPTMFLGVLLRDYLSVDAGLFPVKGFEGPEYSEMTVLEKFRDNVWHLVLPVATLTAGYLALYSRYMKAGLLEIMRADYVRTARAKGLSEFVVVLKHAVRNGLIPIITLLGGSLPFLIGGSIVIEVIFGIDGMGRLGYEAVRQTDYAVIMGINVLTAVLTMVGIFLADLCYAVADPRISYR
ncbi:MAG: ABC transporter permease, partial [Myxococcota bacterium]